MELTTVPLNYLKTISPEMVLKTRFFDRHIALLHGLLLPQTCLCHAILAHPYYRHPISDTAGLSRLSRSRHNKAQPTQQSHIQILLHCFNTFFLPCLLSLPLPKYYYYSPPSKLGHIL